MGGEDRAEGRELRQVFDTDAASYDRTRPVLPDALFDDLCKAASLAPGSRVVEIGCGSGQATVPLARRGLSISAVELGPHLAALAKAKLVEFPSVHVITSSFEEWRADGDPFDAVIAVNSLHWIGAELRFAKPAELLRPGGAMVVVGCRWVTPVQPDAFLVAVQDDYRAVGYPGDPPPGADRVAPWHFPPEADGLFLETLALRHAFTVVMSAQDYLAHLATQSTTHQLGSVVAQKFLDRVAHRLTAMGIRDVIRPYVGLLTVGRKITGN